MSREQDAVEVEHFDNPRHHRGPAGGAVSAADDFRFRTWFREEWSARTDYGKASLIVFVTFWSWAIVFIAITARLEKNWPTTYKEIDDDG